MLPGEDGQRSAGMLHNPQHEIIFVFVFVVCLFVGCVEREENKTKNDATACGYVWRLSIIVKTSIARSP